MRKALIFVLSLFLNYSYANEKLTNNDLKEAATVYGFYIGQTYTLDKISTKYPNLNPHIKVSKMAFDSEFKNTIDNIDLKLNSLNKKEWDKAKTKIKSETGALFSQMNLSLNDSINFIEEVKQRANN